MENCREPVVASHRFRAPCDSPSEQVRIRNDQGQTMKLGLGRILPIGVVTLFGLMAARAQPAAQQRPLMAEDVFKNVQVLRGIPVNQFMETMGFFSAALGYNCTNCHGDAVLGSWEKYAAETPVK